MICLPPDRILLFFTRVENITDAGLLASYRSVLSPEETQKVDRYRDKNGGLLSLTARALIRYLISEYTGLGPDEFTFTANDHGKPALSKDSGLPPQARGLKFNLSHCKGAVVCALCLDHDIGVDMEDLGRRVNLSVADRFFSPREATRVRSLDCDDEKKEAFLDIWTLKEAYIKAKGKGLAIPLNSFSFEPAGTGVTISFQDPKINPDTWQFFRWRPEPGKRVAAAVNSARSIDIQTFYCIPFKEIVNA